jgi:hypothetical protein
MPKTSTVRRRGHVTMKDWREMQIEYLSDVRSAPPALNLLPKEDRAWAKAWAAAGANPLQRRSPPTERTD